MGFLFRNKEGDKDRLSIPSVKIVYGYTVRKLPIGAMLEARSLLTSLPQELLETLFPDTTMEEALNQVILLIESADYPSLVAILTELILYVPEMVLELVAHVLGESVERLVTDEALGLDGLVKLVVAIIEVNKLGEVFEDLKGLIRKKEKQITSTGSND